MATSSGKVLPITPVGIHHDHPTHGISIKISLPRTIIVVFPYCVVKLGLASSIISAALECSYLVWCGLPKDFVCTLTPAWSNYSSLLITTFSYTATMATGSTMMPFVVSVWALEKIDIPLHGWRGSTVRPFVVSVGALEKIDVHLHGWSGSSPDTRVLK